MRYSILSAFSVLLYLAVGDTAQASFSCKKIDQAEFDQRFQKDSAAPSATLTDEGDILRVVVMEEKPESLSRSVTVFSKAGHPLHPLVLQRWIFEDRRFYITKNKGWTGADTSACVEALKALIADEGGHDTEEVTLNGGR